MKHLSLVTSEPTLDQIIDAHTAPIRHVPLLCAGDPCTCAQIALLSEIPWRF